MRLRLSCDERAGAAARRQLAHDAALRGVSDLPLLLTELINNAVHACGVNTGRSLEVQVSTRGVALLLSVRNPGIAASLDSGHAPLHETARELGLRIVEWLADDWGVQAQDGYGVWATLPARGGQLAA